MRMCEGICCMTVVLTACWHRVLVVVDMPTINIIYLHANGGGRGGVDGGVPWLVVGAMAS